MQRNIVHHNDIASPQCRPENLRDIAAEAVSRSSFFVVYDLGGSYPVSRTPVTGKYEVNHFSAPHRSKG